VGGEGGVWGLSGLSGRRRIGRPVHLAQMLLQRRESPVSTHSGHPPGPAQRFDGRDGRRCPPAAGGIRIGETDVS
jgi:hypothetical protein